MYSQAQSTNSAAYLNGYETHPSPPAPHHAGSGEFPPEIKGVFTGLRHLDPAHLYSKLIE